MRPLSLWLKLILGALFVLVLVVGFMGYLNPGVRLNWETLATMCGF